MHLSKVARVEGLLIGIPAMPAIFVAAKVAKCLENVRNTFETIVQGSGERYLFAEIFEA